MRALPEVTTGHFDDGGYLDFTHYLPALGDFNRDGHVDLVGMPGIDAVMSLLLGQGDGTFTTKSMDGATAGAWSAAAADFNRDGILDLVSSMTGNVLSVRLGIGDGSFAERADYPASPGPVGLAIADFDGDGNLDLANTNLNGHSVSVRLGQAGGTFAAKVDYSVGDSPSYVVAVDWNGDGILDLAVADTTLHLLLGKGDGSFAKEIACGIFITASWRPSQQAFVAADFDHDGELDLATPDGVLLGMDGCNFARRVDYTGVLLNNFGEAVTTADLNGDGHLDLVLGDIGVYLGDGAGGFANPLTFPSAGTQGVESILVGDLNGDGRLDLVVAASDAWRVLINTCQ